MESANETEDVYTTTKEELMAGAGERSKPGTHPSDKHYDMVEDDAGRLVSNKPSNRPYLRAKAQREAHAARVAEDARRRAARPASFPWTTILLLLLFLPLLSQFSTGSWTFKLSPYFVPPLRRYWSTSPMNFNRIVPKYLTPEKLARYDGSDSRQPLYLAIDGKVFDVSSNRRVYGPGGSYNFMTGKDASRAFVTGCFQTHQTHDLRGLSVEELKSLDHWKSFFADHEKYAFVGYVLNPDIDPSIPIPLPCREEEAPGSSAGASGAGLYGPQLPEAPKDAAKTHARATGEL